MGKDQNGGYVPPKGKPSGSGRETHNLKEAFAVTDPETEKKIADEYTEDGADEVSANVHVRHPNRNVHKGEDLGAENGENN
ncbi:hypothetical protein GCM10027037_09900 [Mucilaginibacter koreensis]